MANATEKALSDIGLIIVSELVQSMRKYNRVATGSTINQIEVTLVGSERMYVTGPAYITALEGGRRKTGAAGPSYPSTANGGISFKERIKLWVAARGIDPKAWYPIYKKINEKGYSGSPGVVTGVLNDKNINAILDDNLGNLALVFTQQIANDLFK